MLRGLGLASGKFRQLPRSTVSFVLRRTPSQGRDRPAVPGMSGDRNSQPGRKGGDPLHSNEAMVEMLTAGR